MDKIREILRRKPKTFLLTALAYLLIVGLLKWRMTPTLNTALFLAGGLLGIYFLDIAEVFFRLNPSPFRSIVFAAALVIVAVFIVTSSESMMATGLVLSMHLSLILWQIGEWEYNGNLNSWYRMIAGTVQQRSQRILLWAFAGLFFVETLLFVR